jgi:hypothetical protein
MSISARGFAYGQRVPILRRQQWHVDAGEWCWCPHHDARGAHGEDEDRPQAYNGRILIGPDLPSGPFSLSQRRSPAEAVSDLGAPTECYRGLRNV